MLPRAALRVCRPRLAANASLIRTYASTKRPPPPRKKTTPAQPKSPLPREHPGAEASRIAKQQNAVKFGGAVSGARTPIQGTRPQDETPSTEAPEAASQEPVAQKLDADEPLPGTIRDEAQAAQAAAENLESPQKPLPDLRQGIPSTFQMEFGNARDFEDGLKAGKEAAGEEQDRASDFTEEQDRKERDDGNQDRSAYETSLDQRRARLANYLYVAIVGGVVVGGLWLARPFGQAEAVPSGLEPGNAAGWAPGQMWERVKARFSSQLGYYTEPTFPELLPEVPAEQRMKYTLVLSLEDLLVHSSWDRKNGYRVAKRPGVDYFIRYLSQYYELVLFTSVPKFVSDQVMIKLDPFHFILWQLGREATKYEGGEYIKDLSYLNRPLDKTLIIDTHAGHVKNQPGNAILLPKWNGDPKDPHAKDLVALIPFLEYIATMGIDDIRTVLKSFEGTDIALEFARREGEARKKFLAELEKEKSKRPSRSLGFVGGALGFKGGMGGNMVLPDGSSVAEGLAQGKMLSDQFREQGQKQYEFIEKQIRENGEQWLKEEAEEQKKMMDAEIQKTKQQAGSFFGFFGGKSSEE